MTFDQWKAREVAKRLDAFGWGKEAAVITSLLAEIERLRAREAGLEERLEWQVKNFVKERDGEVQKQAARIKELEDALVEERANCVMAYEWQEDLPELDECSEAGRYREESRQQLQAEGKIGPDASNSHLRPYAVVAADLAACGSYVGIGPGEGDLPIPERVRRTVNRFNGSVHRYEQKIIAKECQMKCKDARIKELEDALVEERVNANRSGSGHMLMSYLKEKNIDPDKYFSEKATEQLQAEGKIGPDAKTSNENHIVGSDQMVALNTDHECPNAFDDWGNPIYIRVSGHAGAGGQPLQEAGQE